MEDQVPGIDQLVDAGIAAARNGQPAEARSRLTKAVEQAPDNVRAWLWLSSVVDDPKDQERCLQQALAVAPEHAAARKGLALLQRRIVTASLKAGIAATQAGDEETARQQLMEVIERDDANLEGWLWLARVVDNAEDCEICYENVLTLEPENIEAQQALVRLRQDAEQDAEQTAEEPDPTEITPPPASATDPWEKLENEYRCHYCLAPTKPEDRRCPACQKKLFIKIRRRKKRSTGLWILLALQILQTLVSGGLMVVALYTINQLGTGSNSPFFLTTLLQMQYDLSPETMSALSDFWIYVLYLLFCLPFIYSATMLVGLYLRWPIVFYLLLIQAGLGFISSGLDLILSSNSFAIIPAVIAAALSLGYFVFILQLEDDFLSKKRRVLLRLDRDVREGVEFLRRGQEYTSHKMWALSALHFRHAALQLQSVDAYLALAIPCMKLEEYGLAERALSEAARMAPNHPQVAEFTHILEERQKSDQTPTE